MVLDNLSTSPDATVQKQSNQSAFHEVMNDWQARTQPSDSNLAVPVMPSQTDFDGLSGNHLDAPNIFAQTGVDKNGGCTNTEQSTEKAVTDPNWHASSTIDTPQEQKWFNQSEQERQKSLDTDNGYYTVKDGDSMWTIAERAARDQDGKSGEKPTTEEITQKMQEINCANPQLQEQPDLMHAGQKILIPGEQGLAGGDSQPALQVPAAMENAGAGDSQSAPQTPSALENAGTGDSQSVHAPAAMQNAGAGDSQPAATAAEAITNTGTGSFNPSIVEAAFPTNAQGASDDTQSLHPSLTQTAFQSDAPPTMNNMAAMPVEGQSDGTNHAMENTQAPTMNNMAAMPVEGQSDGTNHAMENTQPSPEQSFAPQSTGALQDVESMMERLRSALMGTQQTESDGMSSPFQPLQPFAFEPPQPFGDTAPTNAPQRPEDYSAPATASDDAPPSDDYDQSLVYSA